jgi:hypothetical protein
MQEDSNAGFTGDLTQQKQMRTIEIMLHTWRTS